MRYLREIYDVNHSHGRLQSMEGLRGFAVFMVFLVHYVALSRDWQGAPLPIKEMVSMMGYLGNGGVDLFFVMSGYLIYGALIKKRFSILEYLKKRIRRIFPCFLTVLAVYLVLSFVFPGESKLSGDPCSQLLYIVSNILLLPGVFPVEPIITVSWSLSFEMLFYLTVPLLIIGLRLQERSSGSRVIFIIAAAASVVALSFHRFEYIRLVMFASGCLLSEAGKRFSSSSFDVSGLLAFVFGMSFWWLDREYGIICYLLLAACLLLFCNAVLNVDGLGKRIFCWTPLCWLGNMSYSYFLLHGLVLKGVFRYYNHFLAPESHGIGYFLLVMPPVFLCTVIFSTLLFILVEKPYSIMSQSRLVAKVGLDCA